MAHEEYAGVIQKGPSGKRKFKDKKFGVWFMHVYRKIELGYWWEQNDEKKKMNLLNEKCSLIQRGVRVTI